MDESISVFKKIIKSSFIVGGFFLVILIINDCAGIKISDKEVTSFPFRFQNKSYRILSESPKNKTDNYNQLLGKNLVAFDFAQDGIIDQITVGSMSRREVQKIYDYGIKLAMDKNLLRKKLPFKPRYVKKTNNYIYEIMSFNENSSHPYNQFKIARSYKYSQETTVCIDMEADGTLDELIKGTGNIEKLQKEYDWILDTGLEKGELVRVNNKITVKQK